MQIVAADLAEKDLPFHAETAVGGGGAAGGDQARHHLQLRTQGGGKRGPAAFGRGDFRGNRYAVNWRRPIIRGGGAGDGVVQKRAGVDGLFGHAGVSLRLQIGVGQPEEVHQRGQPVGVRAAARTRSAGQGNRAAGGNGILRHDIADLKRVRAGQGNHQRNRRVGLDGIQQIRAAPAPAGGRRLVGNGGLPLGLLVGVGKKLRRTAVAWPGNLARVMG